MTEIDFLPQAELSVDDFLAADDPRTMAEGCRPPSFPCPVR